MGNACCCDNSKTSNLDTRDIKKQKPVETKSEKLKPKQVNPVKGALITEAEKSLMYAIFYNLYYQPSATSLKY